MSQKYPNCTSKKHPESGSREKLQWARLLCSVLLFLAVFLGKQIYPEKIVAIGSRVVTLLGQTTDFEAVFSELGSSLQDVELLHGIEEFCVEVFGPNPSYEATSFCRESPNLPQISSVQTYQQTLRAELHTFCAASSDSEPLTNDRRAIPAVGSILAIGEKTGQPFPEGYTADKLSFGDLETVNPVLGYLNSGFGYREHPVNGKYCFHAGTDISANSGDPIAAFAKGKVEYVGEDDSYGLYVQLDHGNGIKSFYAHCQSVCVQKGQEITAGETIATVGSTGRATGPHLHLELKCGNLRVDPAYYVDFLAAI